jgi:hypothetical protein
LDLKVYWEKLLSLARAAASCPQTNRSRSLRSADQCTQLIGHREHTEDFPVPFSRVTELGLRRTFWKRCKRVGASLWNRDKNFFNARQNG